MLLAFGLAAFFLAQVAALIMIPLGLPGTVVQLVAAATLAWATDGARLAWSWVAGFGVLVVVGELAELLAGRWGARRFGGSSLSGWGALFGGIFGAFIGIPVPVVGSIVGSFVGTFVGALAAEIYVRGGEIDLRVGVGALLGRVAATAVKLTIAFTILVLSAASLLADLLGDFNS
jgi:uncharacterized protein YqgC (DUF456 family)